MNIQAWRDSMLTSALKETLVAAAINTSVDTLDVRLNMSEKMF